MGFLFHWKEPFEKDRKHHEQSTKRTELLQDIEAGDYEYAIAFQERMRIPEQKMDYYKDHHSVNPRVFFRCMIFFGSKVPEWTKYLYVGVLMSKFPIDRTAPFHFLIFLW